MKRAILLVLAYMAAQLLLGGLFSVLSLTGVPIGESWCIVLGLWLSAAIMLFVLWRYEPGSMRPAGVVPGWRLSGLSLLAGVSAIYVVSALSPVWDKLPNLMEETMDGLLRTWEGLLTVAVIGPVLEELLFRGAVVTVLLRHYTPGKAVVLSALVFGLFHINPVQIPAAFLIGLLLAWLFVRTRSLLPCVLVHVVNNSLSAWWSVNHPQTDDWTQLLGTVPAMLCLTAAVALLAFSIYNIWKAPARPPRQEE